LEKSPFFNGLLGIGSEDFDLIPTNQDLYCLDAGNDVILKIPRALLAPYVGDLLITQSGDGYAGVTPALFIVSWSSSTTNFIVTSFSRPNEDFEQATFAPLNLPTQ
jgi:hypothetical protein